MSGRGGACFWNAWQQRRGGGGRAGASEADDSRERTSSDEEGGVRRHCSPLSTHRSRACAREKSRVLSAPCLRRARAHPADMRIARVRRLAPRSRMRRACAFRWNIIASCRKPCSHQEPLSRRAAEWGLISAHPSVASTFDRTAPRALLCAQPRTLAAQAPGLPPAAMTQDGRSGAMFGEAGHYRATTTTSGLSPVAPLRTAFAANAGAPACFSGGDAAGGWANASGACHQSTKLCRAEAEAVLAASGSSFTFQGNTGSGAGSLGARPSTSVVTTEAGRRKEVDLCFAALQSKSLRCVDDSHPSSCTRCGSAALRASSARGPGSETK